MEKTLLFGKETSVLPLLVPFLQLLPGVSRRVFHPPSLPPPTPHGFWGTGRAVQHPKSNKPPWSSSTSTIPPLSLKPTGAFRAPQTSEPTRVPPRPPRGRAHPKSLPFRGYLCLIPLFPPGSPREPHPLTCVRRLRGCSGLRHRDTAGPARGRGRARGGAGDTRDSPKLPCISPYQP